MNKQLPPELPLRFFRWYCHPKLRDGIEGDLIEVYQERMKEKGKLKADLKFIIDVMLLFRSGIIKPSEGYRHLNSYCMYKSHFKVALRNLQRHGSFTFINVAGLTLGIACVLFIYLIISYELSYDRYHAKADRVYRVNRGKPGDENPGTPHGLAAVLRSEFPEIEEVGIIFKLNPEESNIEINKELFREPNTFMVQPQFFRLMDFQWLQGKPDLLSGSKQAVVTQSIAKKYYRGDAIGKALRLNNWEDFTIVGIIADPPVNTDFPIKIALSYSTLEKAKDSGLTDKLDGGANSYSQTYFTLREGVDPSTIPLKLSKMVERHVAKDRQKFVTFSIQPLNDIHFNIGNFNQRIISMETINTLKLIGLFVLVVACINFINLASALAIKRAKEVGIRKTMGSSRSSLVVQFLCETFLVTFISFVLGFLIVSQLLNFSERLFSIPLSTEALVQTETFLFMGVSLIGVTLLSGFYPAFVLSGYLPINALKGMNTAIGIKGLFVRKGLITFQFLTSQVLIVCTIIVIRQTNYFLSKPLGFDKEAVVTFDLPGPDWTPSVLSALKNNLLSHNEIKAVSFSLNTPSATINKWWANVKHASFPGEEKSVEVKLIDSTYLRMFEIGNVAGTTLLPDQTGKNVLVNEDFVRTIGIRDPEKAIGEKITYGTTDAIIIGVVKDFQTVSLRGGVHPVLLTNTGYFAKGSVKIDIDHAGEAIESIERHWKESFAGNYFTYAFLDDDLATFYRDEKKISKLLISFSGIAIIIGCIGLFGLITLVATQRAKEVGIRKVLGASVTHLAVVLSSDFVKLVLMAGLIAWPIAYYVIDEWLQSFANRIALIDNVWVFLLSLIIATLFAMITVSFQTIKVANANPIKSLRSE